MEDPISHLRVELGRGESVVVFAEFLYFRPETKSVGSLEVEELPESVLICFVQTQLSVIIFQSVFPSKQPGKRLERCAHVRVVCYLSKFSTAVFMRESREWWIIYGNEKVDTIPFQPHR